MARQGNVGLRKERSKCLQLEESRVYAPTQSFRFPQPIADLVSDILNEWKGDDVHVYTSPDDNWNDRIKTAFEPLNIDLLRRRGGKGKVGDWEANFLVVPVFRPEHVG